MPDIEWCVPMYLISRHVCFSGSHIEIASERSWLSWVLTSHRRSKKAQRLRTLDALASTVCVTRIIITRYNLFSRDCFSADASRCGTARRKWWWKREAFLRLRHPQTVSRMLHGGYHIPEWWLTGNKQICIAFRGHYIWVQRWSLRHIHARVCRARSGLHPMGLRAQRNPVNTHVLSGSCHLFHTLASIGRVTNASPRLRDSELAEPRAVVSKMPVHNCESTIVHTTTDQYRSELETQFAYAFHGKTMPGPDHRRMRHLRVTQLRFQRTEFTSPGIKCRSI